MSVRRGLGQPGTVPAGRLVRALRRHDLALPARPAGLEARQAGQVRSVAVKALPLARRLQPDGRAASDHAGVAHMAEQVPGGFGIVLGSGAVGLLAGFVVPAIGTAAAIGLVAYFICALSAHIRARDPKVAGAVSFLVMAVAALVVGLGYHYHV